jgi:hypothetical protein
MGLKRKPPPGNIRRVHSTGQNLCGVITNKANRTVQFESFAERSLLLWLDRSPDVQDYTSQPEHITFFDTTGKQHTYIPDFKVWHTDGQISLHEVTLSHRLEKPTLQQRHAAAAQACQERGWRYLIHTEDTLPQGSELANLLALWPFRSTVYDHRQVRLAVCKDLKAGEHRRLYDLVIQLAQRSGLAIPLVAACLYHLLWHDTLTMDWHQLLFDDAVPQPEAEVWLTQTGGVS